MIQIPNNAATAAEALVNAYGEEAQIRQTMEECGELIVALNKHLRVYKDIRSDKIHGQQAIVRLSQTRTAVCEEIADVIIMCCQMAYIHDPSEIDVNTNIKAKIERQLKRLEAAESNEQGKMQNKGE